MRSACISNKNDMVDSSGMTHDPSISDVRPRWARAPLAVLWGHIACATGLSASMGIFSLVSGPTVHGLNVFDGPWWLPFYAILMILLSGFVPIAVATIPVTLATLPIVLAVIAWLQTGLLPTLLLGAATGAVLGAPLLQHLFFPEFPLTIREALFGALGGIFYALPIWMMCIRPRLDGRSKPQGLRTNIILVSAALLLIAAGIVVS